MKRIFNGVEFTEIEYIIGNDGPQPGLLIHDINDVNHDGDGIIGNGVQLPENPEDARIIIEGEYIETAFTLKDNIYYI